MKKIIAAMLAICMIISLGAVPASAFSICLNWPDWSKAKEWQAALPNQEASGEPGEAEETETPEESEPAEEYIIRYDANGGYFWSQYASPAITSTKKYTVTAGNTHKLISAPQRSCYTFQGWADADGNLYQPGDQITPTGDLALSAQWK